LLLPLLRNFSSNAYAQDQKTKWDAKVEASTPTPENTGIPFLEWTKDVVHVDQSSYLNYVDLEGHLKEKVLQVMLNGKPIPLDHEEGFFKIRLGFPGQSKTFLITVVDQNEKKLQMQYFISPVDHSEITIEKNTRKRWQFGLGIGGNLVSFRQFTFDSFDEYAIQLKGSVDFNFSDRFSLGLNTSFDAFSLDSNSPANLSIQIAELEIRLGWKLFRTPSPFQITLYLGENLITSLSETIGFKNIYGPGLRPELSYTFGNGNRVLVYGKYSMLLSKSVSGVGITSNREVSLGSAFSFPISYSNRLWIGLDASQLNLDTTSPSNWVSMNTYGLSVGISF